MGGLISGLVGLFEGDPAKAQENQLSSLAGYETGVGEGLTTAASTFDEAILSGDPTRISAALAPEISTQQQQIQQAANKNAQFGTRSGGTAASTAGAEAAGRGNIINLEGELQKGAAANAGTLGGNLLSQSSGNTSKVASLKGVAQQNQLNEIGGIAQGVGEIISGFGGGGLDETPIPEAIPEAAPDDNPDLFSGIGDIG